MPLIPSDVRAVFFDAVGTLLFPEPSAPSVYADAARLFGLHLSASEVRTRFIAAYRREEAADVAAKWVTSEDRERDRWRVIVADTLAGVTDLEACYGYLFDHFAKPSAWHVAPDTAEVLLTLQSRGFILGMGSNYDARLWSLLDAFQELAPLRERVIISAAVGVRKPGLGFFHEVTRAAGCEPGSVLFVGDDVGNDYEGATAAEMHAMLLDLHAKHPNVPHRITQLVELLY